ncbi:MAG TPA: hypothetical protein VFS68_07105 [Candidatus Udaeobacter sp.]|jgi:hypothetical protein|nr:hypothetical protein [Candidatus Udaeobacter sp.]
MIHIPVAEGKKAPNLLPAIFVLGVLLWIFTTTGGRQIFVNEILSEAYDSQAEHFLRGDVGVDGDAIRHEAMIVNGRVCMYFGPFPAFVRIPLNFVYPGGRGHWSRITGFCAGIIALAAFAGLIRLALRSSQLSDRWKNWLGNICLIGFALGSPLLLLLGNLSIYDEAIIWALAWSLAALYFALRSRETEGAALTRSLLAFSLCAGCALLSRLTFGAPLLLIAPVLALRVLRKNQIRNLAALLLPIGAALLFYLLLSYAKFGNFRGEGFDHYVNTDQRQFTQKHGFFRLQRVPYSFVDYFALRYPEYQRTPPFLKAYRHPYNYPDLYAMPFTETYSSLIWYSSWIVLGAIIGVALLFKPGGHDAVDRMIAAILFIQVIGIMSVPAVIQRYATEFYPFLVFAFFFFLHSGRAAFHLRYLLIGLVAVSIVINSLSTVAWLVDADMNVPQKTRDTWKAFLGRKSQ